MFQAPLALGSSVWIAARKGVRLVMIVHREELMVTIVISS